MATQLLSPIGILVQQLANSGQPLTGGQIFIYQAGTTTPITTYTDSTGGTPNANPIVLNSAGRLPNVSVWVPSNTPHKMVLEDANNVTLSTIDQLYGINDPFLINQVSTTLPTGSGTANAQTIANSVAITSQANGTEQWYIPGVSNTGPTNINVDGLGNMAARYLTKALVGGELQAGVPVLIKSDGTFWNLAWSAKGPLSDFYTDSGAVNAYVITANMATAPGAGQSGSLFKVQITNTNTASPTLNVNGSGALNIYYADGVTQLAAGSLIASAAGPYLFIYNRNLNSGAGGYICINPSRVTGSATLTLATGWATTPTGTVNYSILPDGKTAYAYFASALTATSNAGTFAVTGWPTILQPTTTKRLTITLEDNGAVAVIPSAIIINSGSGTINGTLNVAGTGGFTTTAVKGFIAGTEFSFTLD